MKLPSCPRTLIINILRKNLDGLTLTSIAELTGLHRHTATKYVYELKGAGIINERDVGSAKLCYLKEGLSREEQKKVVERLNGTKGWHENRRKSSTGQVQLLSLFVLLFLVPTSVIIAQNATTNISSEGNLVLEQVNISNSQANSSEPGEAVITTEIPESNKTNETFSEENVTQTHILSEENATGNETILPDVGIFENFTDNATIQEQENPTNETIQEPESPVTEISEPVLEARILSPDKITRGERFDISGVVKNSGTGEAKNVRLSWGIPSGFELISGEIEMDCGMLPPDSECSSSLTLSSSLSIETGRSELKILVKYEE